MQRRYTPVPQTALASPKAELAERKKQRRSTDATVQVVERSVRILRAMSGGAWYGISELVEKTGLPKTTVHRLIQAWVQVGVIERDEDMPKYRLCQKGASMPEEALTVDDLKRVYIRAQFPDGHWASVNCYECSDEQFDTWIRTRIVIQGGNEPWSLQERLDVVSEIWNRLTVLKKEGED